MVLQGEAVAHKKLLDGSEITDHSHPGGGSGPNVKSGTVTTSGSSGSVTFNTAFSSTPRVTLTPYDGSLNLRDCLWVIRSISTTGFSFDVDADATYIWIATDAGNP